MSEAASLAVWDIPAPAVIGERFSIKVGAKGVTGRVEIIDSGGAVVASGTPGPTPWPGSEALHWVELDVPAPATTEVAKYTARCGKAETWFCVAVAAKSEHTLTVQITERDSKAPLDGVEIRVGPFHARTDKAGRAELRVCKGAYQLHLWRTAHLAHPVPVEIAGDTSVALTMLHVPEEHPDARWVR